MTKEIQGNSPVTVSLDPEEFRGMSLARTENEVRAVLHSIAPNASFFEGDVESLAAELYQAVAT